MKHALPDIEHNQEGFSALIALHEQMRKCFLDDIEIDMSGTSWFDADMRAPFGAILYSCGEHLNTVRLTNIRPTVETILSKNGFLSHYGGEKIPDRWGTTIPYQRFDVQDDRYFASYIETELMRRSELPKMSVGLSKKFRESLFEIFSNAVLHAQTEEGIFGCGQFYPKRNRLDFSVADLGVGIRRKVVEHTGAEFTPEAAIKWATEDRNTTKGGPIPGGLGLKLLGEFIDLNGGSLQIVSDAGFWRRKMGKIDIGRFAHPFPGTVVSVEIDTSDTRSYALTSELREEDIF